jgi:hypothetical protein
MHAKRPPAIAREECPSSPNATATSLRCSDVRCRRPGQGGAFLGTSWEDGAAYFAFTGDVPPHMFPGLPSRLGTPAGWREIGARPTSSVAQSHWVDQN